MGINLSDNRLSWLFYLTRVYTSIKMGWAELQALLSKTMYKRRENKHDDEIQRCLSPAVGAWPSSSLGVPLSTGVLPVPTHGALTVT